MKPGPRSGLVAVLLMTLVAACCTSHPAGETTIEPHGGNEPVRISSAPISPSSRTDVPSSNPGDVAAQWFTAYHAASWTDPSPASWIDRVHPYITPSMHVRDEALRDGGSGNDWAEFVADHCVAEVSDVDIALPAEAPNTADVVYVQVIGTVRTTCSRRQPAIPVAEESATLAVSRTPDGWLVNERLY